jgi:hypothetical protein
VWEWSGSIISKVKPEILRKLEDKADEAIIGEKN